MLKASNITKIFNDNKVVLDNVNFKLPIGSIMVILGPSGSGKTTLLRSIAQLEKLTEGTLFFKNTPLLDLNRGSIGLVFQNFHLFPHLSVLKNITLALRCQNKTELFFRSLWTK